MKRFAPNVPAKQRNERKEREGLDEYRVTLKNGWIVMTNNVNNAVAIHNVSQVDSITVSYNDAGQITLYIGEYGYFNVNNRDVDQLIYLLTNVYPNMSSSA